MDFDYLAFLSCLRWILACSFVFGRWWSLMVLLGLCSQLLSVGIGWMRFGWWLVAFWGFQWFVVVTVELSEQLSCCSNGLLWGLEGCWWLVGLCPDGPLGWSLWGWSGWDSGRMLFVWDGWVGFGLFWVAQVCRLVGILLVRFTVYHETVYHQAKLYKCTYVYLYSTYVLNMYWMLYL